MFTEGALEADEVGDRLADVADRALEGVGAGNVEGGLAEVGGQRDGAVVEGRHLPLHEARLAVEAQPCRGLAL